MFRLWNLAWRWLITAETCGQYFNIKYIICCVRLLYPDCQKSIVGDWDEIGDASLDVSPTCHWYYLSTWLLKVLGQIEIDWGINKKKRLLYQYAKVFKTITFWMFLVFYFRERDPIGTDVNIYQAENYVTLGGVLLAVVNWLAPDWPRLLLIALITANW
jgi:hypothetical protein